MMIISIRMGYSRLYSAFLSRELLPSKATEVNRRVTLLSTVLLEIWVLKEAWVNKLLFLFVISPSPFQRMCQSLEDTRSSPCSSEGLNAATFLAPLTPLNILGNESGMIEWLKTWSLVYQRINFLGACLFTECISSAVNFHVTEKPSWWQMLIASSLSLSFYRLIGFRLLTNHWAGMFASHITLVCLILSLFIKSLKPVSSPGPVGIDQCRVHNLSFFIIRSVAQSLLLSFESDFFSKYFFLYPQKWEVLLLCKGGSRAQGKNICFACKGLRFSPHNLQLKKDKVTGDLKDPATSESSC